MLIATAGHIDHGKTALVRALSGVETDRLPEERTRGISIDLGFAYWRPDGGATIGFVDVPGHERYVRNMLAGIGGLRFALLVVAADDGIMPQTIEHLRMLDLMGIARGAVVLTKCDRADRARILAVRTAVHELLAPTSLHDAAMFEVASPSGAGIPELQAALIAERDNWLAENSEGLGFRLAIDRAFSVTGTGTVVTGTVIAGKLTAGATLTLSPSGRELRVRGIECAGEAVERVAAGKRCALNLAGIAADEIRRGDWLVEPGLHAPTARIEARIEVLAALRHDTRLHLHHGAADLGARILTPRQRVLQPGTSSVVQLVLDRPTSAVNGERFVLRDQAGRELIGGGTVLDPLATDRRRSLAVRERSAAAQALSEPAEALRAMAAIPGVETGLSRFQASRNLLAENLTDIVAAADLVRFGRNNDQVVHRTRFEHLCDGLVALLASEQSDHPDRGGMTRRAARLALAEPVSAELLAVAIARLIAANRIETAGALLRLPGHSPSFSPAETAQWNGALAALEAQGPRPIGIAELALELRATEASLRAMLYRRRIDGAVWQVTESKFVLREHVAALAALAAELDAPAGAGFTAARFRDASGLGRNFTIELLEFFDRIGVTRRTGEARRMRGEWQAVTGPANCESEPTVSPATRPAPAGSGQ